jgi:hypothetical protein
MRERKLVARWKALRVPRRPVAVLCLMTAVMITASVRQAAFSSEATHGCDAAGYR